MKKIIYVLFILGISACSNTTLLHESDFLWTHKYKYPSRIITVKNDSLILYGYDSQYNAEQYPCFVLDSTSGEIIYEIAHDIISPDFTNNDSCYTTYPYSFYLGGGIHHEDIGTSSKYKYKITALSYERRWRWQQYDKQILKITRKKDNKYVEILMDKSYFRSVYQFVPFGTSKLILYYNAYIEGAIFIALLDVDVLFKAE